MLIKVSETLLVLMYKLLKLKRGNVYSVSVFFSADGYFLVCDGGRGSCGMWAVNLLNKV
jgi:hypothetical protein